MNYQQISELAQNRPNDADQTYEQRRVLKFIDSGDLPCAFGYDMPLALFILRNVVYWEPLARGNYELVSVSCAKANRKPFCSWRAFFRSRDPAYLYEDSTLKIFKNIFVRNPSNTEINRYTVETGPDNVMYFVILFSLKRGDPVMVPTICRCGRNNFNLSLTLPHIVGVDLESEVEIKGKWKKIIFYYRNTLKLE